MSFRFMFLNINYQGKKEWKPFWVSFDNFYLNISQEHGKDPIVSYHIGVMQIKLSTEHPDKPDVLEFVPMEGFTSVSFCVFTYDPFDIINFYKTFKEKKTEWENAIRSNPPIVLQSPIEVKTTNLISKTLVWSVNETFVSRVKRGSDQSMNVYFNEIKSVTPINNPSHVGSFSFVFNDTSNEYRPKDLQSMRTLLNAIYFNKAKMLSLQTPEEPAPPAPVPVDSPVPSPETE